MSKRLIKTNLRKTKQPTIVQPIAKWQRMMTGLIRGDVLGLLMRNNRQEITAALALAGFTYMTSGTVDSLEYVLGLLNGEHMLFFQFDGRVITCRLAEGEHYTKRTNEKGNTLITLTYNVNDLVVTAREMNEQAAQQAENTLQEETPDAA